LGCVGGGLIGSTKKHNKEKRLKGGESLLACQQKETATGESDPVNGGKRRKTRMDYLGQPLRERGAFKFRLMG